MQCMLVCIHYMCKCCHYVFYVAVMEMSTSCLFEQLSWHQKQMQAGRDCLLYMYPVATTNLYAYIAHESGKLGTLFITWLMIMKQIANRKLTF